MQPYIFEAITRWHSEGRPVALATIMRIRGSSNQPLGARMAITTDDEFIGSVSGGCVEADVYEAGRTVFTRGKARMLAYQHVEHPDIEVGLSCDGAIDVLVEPCTEETLAFLSAAPPRAALTLCYPDRADNPAPEHVYASGSANGDSALPPSLREAAAACLADEKRRSVTLEDGRVALVEALLGPPLLLIFGATEVALPLTRLARTMGFQVIVTDPRGRYADPRQHRDADGVIAAWPTQVAQQLPIGKRTYIVSLNHEARFEDELFRTLMHTERPAYIGAIGQRDRHTERLARSHEEGYDLSRLPTVHTPIGLSIGTKKPEEIALSIMAEIVAVRNGKKGGFLSARYENAATVQ